MDKRLLRPLLIFEFLVAVEAVFTLWSQIGGQYHLDLMFWPWKAGLGLGAAALIVAITGSVLRNEGAISRRTLLLFSLLLSVAIAAGVVTYYYHVNEPADQEQNEDQPVRTSVVCSPDRLTIPGTRFRPGPSASRLCS